MFNTLGNINQLGCCNDTHGHLGDLGLGACPNTATVYVEETGIPPLILWIAAGWAALMLLKRGR